MNMTSFSMILCIMLYHGNRMESLYLNPKCEENLNFPSFQDSLICINYYLTTSTTSQQKPQKTNEE